MQLAIGAITKLFGGASAASAAGSSSLALSVLQGGASVLGLLATIGAGKAEAQSLKTKAFESDIEAKNEEAQGLQRTGAMKRELLRIIGENDVNYAAAGIDIGPGVASEARATAERRAAQEISIDRSTTEARAAMLRAQAHGYRSLARQAKKNRLFEGLSTAFTSFAGIAERG